MKRVFSFAALAMTIGLVGCSNPTPIAQSDALSDPKAPASHLPSSDVTSPVSPANPQGDTATVFPAQHSNTRMAAEDSTANAATETPKSTKVHYVAQEKKWGTLKAKFVLDGTPPARKKVTGVQDPICAALPLESESMLVSKDGGIQNLVLQMFVDKQNPVKDIHPDLAMPKTPEVVLDNNKCTFIPHILVARVGQAVNVKNGDATGHNANFQLFNNQGENFLVPAGGSKVGKQFTKDEVAPMPIDCNIHPWMKAFVVITSHPYVGVTDENGVVEIPNLPVGKITFKAWHESQDKFLDEANVDGKPQKWAKARFEYEIKEGVNDLGVIKISAKKFKS